MPARKAARYQPGGRRDEPDTGVAAVTAAFAIVDPHQHFWDLRRNYYPWLCDEQPIPFRYGDYSAIRRNYMPPDYLADAGPYRIVATAHIEAEWAPADPVAETRWLAQLAEQHGP